MSKRHNAPAERPMEQTPEGELPMLSDYWKEAEERALRAYPDLTRKAFREMLEFFGG